MNTVLIMSSILFVITVLLLVADRVLVTYGECTITVTQDDEKKELVVQGGAYLLTNLSENNIPVNSSCGGKATCGYCKVKVLSGGGQMLPTEDIFMSREEKRAGMRIACQVKVKNDIEIYIPDFLTTVRSIVRNKTYDPKLRWKFIIAPQPADAIEKITGKIGPAGAEKVQKIVEAYKGKEGALIPVLQRAQETFNYLSEPVLGYISKQMNIPLSLVFRTATFYNAFSLKPRGKYIINICLGTACHVKGAADILSVFERELGLQTGDTTKDMLFTLDTVRCIGCCGLAPVLKVNEDIHGLMTKKKVSELIKRYKS